MRIPVTQSDLQNGHYTKIARALQKILPNESLGLMHAQNALAILLGYRDLHDIQSIASRPTVPGQRPWSRTTINNTVGWKLFRHHGVNLDVAAELVAKLHLQMLDVDAATPEASFERTQKEYKAKGQFLIQDEYWDYANPSWNEKTPQLLDADIPGYSYAVLPNKTVFRWSLLEDLLAMLPEDFTDDLEDDLRYKDCSDSKTQETAFIKQELYPQACVTLLNTAKVAQILPIGFKIMWIFADGGDYMGQCIGRVLHNEALGGIIPIVFPSDTDDIFEAIGQLLCGETIVAHTELPTTDDASVFVQRFGYGGYDLAKDTRPDYGENVIKAERMIKLPDSIRYRVLNDRFVLCGHTFVESGQTYLRHQNWMRSSEVPTTILDGYAFSKGDAEYLGSVASIPVPALALFAFAEENRNLAFEKSQNSLGSMSGLDAMTRLAFEILAPSGLDAYCDVLLDDDMPIRDEDGAEDQDLIDDRTREVERMVFNGEKIKEVYPLLAILKDSTLGYILLAAHGEYPCARHSGWVSAPEAGDLRGLSKLLLDLIFHAVCCTTTRKRPGSLLDLDALAFVVNRVLDGMASSTEIFDDYFEINAFCKRLAEQAKVIGAIKQWREADAAMRETRSHGEFLYVGSPVGHEKPKGLADLYAMTRSAGFAPMLMEQKLSDFASIGIAGSNDQVDS